MHPKQPPAADDDDRALLAQHIGAAIAHAREELRKTSAEFAQEIGISRNSLSTWENGRGLPDTLSLARLARRLRISLDELILGVEDAKGLWLVRLASAGFYDESDSAPPSTVVWEKDLMFSKDELTRLQGLEGQLLQIRGAIDKMIARAGAVSRIKLKHSKPRSGPKKLK